MACVWPGHVEQAEIAEIEHRLNSTETYTCACPSLQAHRPHIEQLGCRVAGLIPRQELEAALAVLQEVRW